MKYYFDRFSLFPRRRWFTNRLAKHRQFVANKVLLRRIFRGGVHGKWIDNTSPLAWYALCSVFECRRLSAIGSQLTGDTICRKCRKLFTSRILRRCIYPSRAWRRAVIFKQHCCQTHPMSFQVKLLSWLRCPRSLSHGVPPLVFNISWYFCGFVYKQYY